MRKSVLIQAGRRHLDLERVDLIDICHEDDDLLLAGGGEESGSFPLTENHGSSSPRRGTEEKEPFSSRNMNVIEEGFVVQGNNVKNGQEALPRSKSFQQSEPASFPSSLPDTVEDVALKKKVKGRTNLRKSLAWNKAFFTDEGVLDVDELQIMSKTPKKPVQLPVIEIPDLPKPSGRVASREAADPLHSSGSVVLAAEASASATGKLDLATEATAVAPGKLISTGVSVESSEKVEVAHSTSSLNSSLRDVMPEGSKLPPRSTTTRSAASSIGGGKPSLSSLQGNSSKLLAVADVLSKTKVASSLKHEAASRGKLEAASKAKLDTSSKIKPEAASKFTYNLRSKPNLQAKAGDSSKQITTQKSSSGSSAVAKQDIAVSSSSASIPKAKPSGLRMPAPKLGFFESVRTNPTSSLPDKSGVAGSNTGGGPVTGRTLPPRGPDVSARTKPPTGRTAQTMDPLAAAVHASVQSGIPSAPHLRVSAYNLRSRAASASAPASPHKGRASAGSAPASPQRNPRMFSSGAEQSRQGTPATSPAKMESRHGVRVKVQNHDSPARTLNSGAGQLEYAVAGSSGSSLKDSLKGSSVRSPPGLQSRPGTGLDSALHAVPEHGGHHVIPRAQAEPARSISGVVVSKLMKYSGSSASPPPPSSGSGPRLVRCTSSPMVLNRNPLPSTVPGKSPLANATPKKESRSFFSLARKAVSRLTSSSSSPKEAGPDKENGNVQSPAASKKTRRFFESARTTEISTPPEKSGLASSKGGSVPLAGRALPPKVPDSNGQSKLPSPPVVRAAQSMDPSAAAVHAGVQSNIPSAPHLRGSDNTSRSRIPSASAPTSPQKNDSRFLSSGAEQSFEGPSLTLPSKPEYRYGSFAQGLAGRLKSGTRQPGSPGSAAASSPRSLSTNSAHQGPVVETDSSSSLGVSGALQSVSEGQPREVDPEVPATLSPGIPLQAGAKPLGTPDHMVSSPLQPITVNDAEPGGHLMLLNTGSSGGPAGGNTPISLTKLAGLTERRNSIRSTERRNSISLGVSAATFCGDREGCQTDGLNILTRCEETSGADDRNSDLQGAGTVVHGPPSEPKEAVGMGRLSNGGESVSSPSHWVDWHKFQERTPDSKTLIPKPGGARSVSPVLVAQLMKNSQSGSSPTSSSSGDGPRLVRCTSSPMVMNGRSPLANAAPKRRESRSFFSLARKAVSKLTSSPSSSGKAGQETEKADGQPLPASQLGRRLSKSGQSLQNRRDSTDRAEGDSQDGNESAQNVNESAQTGVLEEVKKLPPFTEEWIAALEAAGQEALEMKGGSVQNSPPNKISPKFNPWSPVRRNGLGPFDCTKRCS